MKYEPKAIEFETLPDGDFVISLFVSGIEPSGSRNVSVKASELQNLSFIQTVVLFRDRINGAFGFTQ
jgi:hypothetical protein